MALARPTPGRAATDRSARRVRVREKARRLARRPAGLRQRREAVGAARHGARGPVRAIWSPPPATSWGVYDREIVVWRDGRLDWDAPPQRSGSATRVAEQAPASFVSFDLLALDGREIPPPTGNDRRVHLDDAAAGRERPLQLSPYTLDQADAVLWLGGSPAIAGAKRLVVKRAGTVYRPGERQR